MHWNALENEDTYKEYKMRCSLYSDEYFLLL